jgi:hypothetical protein
MARIDIDTVEAPAHWATYLINGDASGMAEDDIRAADTWRKQLRGAYVTDCSEETEFAVFNGLLTELATYTIYTNR